MVRPLCALGKKLLRRPEDGFSVWWWRGIRDGMFSLLDELLIVTSQLVMSDCYICGRNSTVRAVIRVHL